jgi:hypothetical protein
LSTLKINKKEKSPFYTKSDSKLVRKPVEPVYGKKDYEIIKTLGLTPWLNV